MLAENQVILGKDKPRQHAWKSIWSSRSDPGWGGIPSSLQDLKILQRLQRCVQRQHGDPGVAGWWIRSNIPRRSNQLDVFFVPLPLGGTTSSLVKSGLEVWMQEFQGFEETWNRFLPCILTIICQSEVILCYILIKLLIMPENPIPSRPISQNLLNWIVNLEQTYATSSW